MVEKKAGSSLSPFIVSFGLSTNKTVQRTTYVICASLGWETLWTVWHVLFVEVHKDHLFPRWCDQQGVGHWAVSKSGLHEDRGRWTPQRPTSLGAPCKTCQVEGWDAPADFRWCEQKHCRPYKPKHHPFNKVLRDVHENRKIIFICNSVKMFAPLTSGRNGWSGQVWSAVWTRAPHHTGVFCSAANMTYEKWKNLSILSFGEKISKVITSSSFWNKKKKTKKTIYCVRRKSRS